MTISAWVKLPPPTTWYPSLIEYMPATYLPQGFLLQFNGTIYPAEDQGKIYYSLFPDRNTYLQTGDLQLSPTPVTYNTWSYVVFTYDSINRATKLCLK